MITVNHHRLPRKQPTILTECQIPTKLYKTRKPIRGARYKSRVKTASARHLPLVPASRNPKMGGNAIACQRWRGKRLYYLALIEGKTCPASCVFRKTGLCGASNFAGLRFRVNDQLFEWIERQLEALVEKYPEGIVVRLHVSGDFPNTEYVRFWVRMLKKFPTLCVWGHTHRRGAFLRFIDSALNGAFPGRCCIRGSETYASKYSAVTVFPVGRLAGLDVVMCPGTLTRASGGPQVKSNGDQPLAHCNSCGLCWNPDVSVIGWPLMRNGKGYVGARMRSSK